MTILLQMSKLVAESKISSVCTKNLSVAKPIIYCWVHDINKIITIMHAY